VLRRSVICFGFLLMTVSLLQAENAQPVAIEWEKDLDRAKSTMAEGSQPMVLFISAPGCHYCELMKQKVFTQPWISKEISQNYVPVMINGLDQKELATRLQIRAYPAIVIVHPTGAVMQIARGYKNPTEFAKFLNHGKAKLDFYSKTLASRERSTKLK